MNKFSQWVITICVIVITILAVLSYLKIEKINNNTGRILTEQQYIGYDIGEMRKKLDDIEYEISFSTYDTPTYSDTKHDFTEDIYYYTSEIYELLKKRF